MQLLAPYAYPHPIGAPTAGGQCCSVMVVIFTKKRCFIAIQGTFYHGTNFDVGQLTPPVWGIYLTVRKAP